MKIFKSKVKSKKARLFLMFHLLFLTLCLCVFVVNLSAQTTEFTYQGRLLDNTLPPTASYDFEFSLWDALSGGTQVGATQTMTGIAVTGGVFTVRLDFGAQFDGAARFIEIHVRPAGGGAYATLAPRQTITSAPYSIRSLNSTTANTATDAQNLGGLPASDYVTNSTLSGSFIRNQTTPQANSNFNVSGSGIVGGSLTVNGASPNGLFLTNGSANFKAGITGNFVSLGTTTNSPLSLSTNNGTNNGSLTLDTSGNIGINTIFPNHKLTIDTLGGPNWTTQLWGGSIALRNSSAIGWQLNSAGQSFGIGQSSDGLSFFHTNSGPGTTLQPPFYEMQITNAGNVGIGTTAPNAKLFVQGEYNGVGIAATGNAAQGRDKGGWVKAMAFVLADGTIARCYNGVTGASTGSCGIQVLYFPNDGKYTIAFPFSVEDRFAIVTPDFFSSAAGPVARFANLKYVNLNIIDVATRHESGGFQSTAFTIVVY